MPRLAATRTPLPMYVVTLTYTRPLTVVDTHHKAHLDWARHTNERGRFLVSGLRGSRKADVIQTCDMPCENLDVLVAEDPFCRQSGAAYSRVGFKVSNAAGDLQQSLEC